VQDHKAAASSIGAGELLSHDPEQGHGPPPASRGHRRCGVAATI